MARPARALWAIGSITLLVCVLIVTDALPWLRGDVPWIPEAGRWVWDYGALRWAWAIACAAGVAVYAWGALRLLRATADASVYPVRLVLWAYGGAVLLPLLVLALQSAPLFVLFTRAVSPITGGYAYAAVMAAETDDAFVNWPDFVAGYREARNVHPPSGAALSPPGLVMIYRAAGTLFEQVPPVAEQVGSAVRPLQCQNLDLMTWDDSALAATWLQIFMPFWAGLALLPLYRLGVLVFDAASARLAVALWPLVPGLAIFQPRFNVFYALLAALMLLLLWRGIVGRRLAWIALSGGVLSAGLFFNLSLVPLGLLAGLTLTGYRARVTQDLRRLVAELLVFGMGCASVWLAYWGASGQAPWGLVEFLLGQHYDLYRPYWPWLVLHPYDMFLFVGVPVALLALWRITRLRVLWGHAADASRGDVLALAAAITLVVLVLSGTARGETGRVWLFFAPVWVLLAASVLQRLDHRARVGSVAFQALCLLSLGAVLRVNFTALTEPPNPPAAAQAPTFPVYAAFEAGPDAVTLVGLSVDAAPDAVTLHLHWRAETRVKRPYVLALLSIAPDGTPQDTLSWNPLDWDYPPSCWKPGHAFVDTVRVPLGAAAMPGEWLFSLSIRDVFTGETMRVTGPDGNVSGQLGIGPVTVPAAAK